MTHLILTSCVVAVVIPGYYWGASLTFATVFCLWSINFIAMEIEHPFGDDYNDLPVRQSLREVNKSLQMIIGRHANHIPSGSEAVEVMKARCNTEKKLSLAFISLPSLSAHTPIHASISDGQVEIGIGRNSLESCPETASISASECEASIPVHPAASGLSAALDPTHSQ